MASLGGGHLSLCLSPSEIWPEKRGGLFFIATLSFYSLICFFLLQEIRISQLEIELDCCKIEKDQIGLQLEDYTTRYRHDKLLVVVILRIS